MNKVKESYVIYLSYYNQIAFPADTNILPEDFLKSYGYNLFIKRAKKQSSFYRGLGIICASNKILFTDFKKVPKILKYLANGAHEDFQKLKSK